MVYYVDDTQWTFGSYPRRVVFMAYTYTCTLTRGIIIRTAAAVVAGNNDTTLLAKFCKRTSSAVAETVWRRYTPSVPPPPPTGLRGVYKCTVANYRWTLARRHYRVVKVFFGSVRESRPAHTIRYFSPAARGHISYLFNSSSHVRYSASRTYCMPSSAKSFNNVHLTRGTFKFPHPQFREHDKTKTSTNYVTKYVVRGNVKHYTAAGVARRVVGGTRGQTIRCNNIIIRYYCTRAVCTVFSRARDSVAENRNYILILINPKARCGVIA